MTIQIITLSRWALITCSGRCSNLGGVLRQCSSALRHMAPHEFYCAMAPLSQYCPVSILRASLVFILCVSFGNCLHPRWRHRRSRCKPEVASITSQFQHGHLTDMHISSAATAGRLKRTPPIALLLKRKPLEPHQTDTANETTTCQCHVYSKHLRR